MFLVSCGTDLIRIHRIEKAIERLGQPFLDRIWTKVEQADCIGQGRYASLAARFAAKEAAAKALGKGIGVDGISWLDLEINKDKAGQPQLCLHGKAKAFYQAIEGSSLSISLTHDGDFAQAVCVFLHAKAK